MVYFMSEITVDTERLARNLQRGLGHTDDYISVAPAKYRLRSGWCELVSVAIAEHCKNRGILASAKKNVLALPFNTCKYHVIDLLDEDQPDPFILDATFSQFYDYVGLGCGYEEFSGTQVLPPEKIIACRVSQLGPVIGQIALTAFGFRQINSHPLNKYGIDMGDGPLANATLAEIIETYQHIWDVKRYQPLTTRLNTLKQAKIVATYISDKCITVS
jgi:hypothetical protein